MTQKPRFVFVGGAPRSGTTLLQRILTRHSLIAGGNEFQSNRNLRDLHQQMARRVEYLPNDYYTRAQLDERFHTFYRSFFEGVLERKPGAEWISEKTPSNIEIAKSLLDLFEGSRFIHIIRDGRDVLASSLEVGRRAKDRSNVAGPEAFRAAHVAKFISVPRVLRTYRTAIEVDRRLESEPRYLSIRYERLVASPEETVRMVCGFLEIPFEPTSLFVEAGGTTAMRVDGIHHRTEDLGRPIGRTGLEPRRLGKLTSLYATLVLGADLVELDYDRGLTAQTGRALRKAVRRFKS